MRPVYGLEQGIGKPRGTSRWLDCGAGTAQRESAWLRLGPVPAQARKPLQDRLDKAVRRVLESRRRPVARA